MEDRGIIVPYLVAALCCNLTHNLQIRSSEDITFYSSGTKGSFVGRRGYKWPHLLFCVTLRFARGKFAVFGIRNTLNYCVIFICIYTTETFGRALHCRWLEPWSEHTLGTSPWLRFYLCTSKMLLSRLLVEILLSRWCDLKKNVAV